MNSPAEHPTEHPTERAATASRAGRRPGTGGGSRAEILAAARALFAARGFRGTTTRQIAERARVDVALIHHFFGTKSELFAAAIEFPRVAAEIAATLAAPGGDLADRIARLYLERLFVDQIETFSAMLRTVVGDPDDVPALRETMYAVFQRIASQLGDRLGDRAPSPLALQLVAAQMMGILVMRHLVRIEPIASASVDEVVQHLAPAIRALLGAADEVRAPQPERPR